MKIELKDLECYDEMYYIGHLVDVDGSGWVDEFEAQRLLDEINQPEPTLSDRIDTPTLIVIMIMMMGLINGMMGCTSTKATVYQSGSEWKPIPVKSSITGWTYK